MSGLLGRLDLPTGKPIPDDLVDGSGWVLLAKGSIIESAAKVDELLARGVSYREPPSSPGPVAPPSPGIPRSAVPSRRYSDASPFERLREATELLDQLSRTSPTPSDFQQRLSTIASIVVNSCDADPDASLAWVCLDEHLSYSIKHQVDVGVLATVLAELIGLSPRDRLSQVCAALTMNISMVDFQDELHARAGGMTDEEKVRMKRHPIDSFAALAQAGITDPLWLQAVATHHENPDGTGYPRSIEGEQNLSQAGQILRIADMYAARVTHRAFMAAQPANSTLADIVSQGRKQALSSGLSEQFIRALGLYPPGTFVKLACGEVGIVVKRGRSLKQPLVVSLVSSTGGNLGAVRRDTSVDRFAVTGLTSLGEVNVKIDVASLWGTAK